MKEITHKEALETSSLYLDLSDGLLNKIDIFLSNTDLDKNQQKELVKIMEEVFSEGYVQSMTD